MTATRPTTALALAALALTASACTTPGESTTTAASGPQTLSVAFSGGEDHPEFIALADAAEQINRASDGRVSWDLKANGSLGSSSTVLSAVSDGRVDLAVVSGLDLESVNEDFVVLDLPYVFASQEAQQATLADAAVQDALWSSLEDSRSITVLAGLYAGTRNIFTTEGPITTPEDLADLTIRVPSNQTAVTMIEQMGGVAAPLAYGEIHAGLANGTLDGAEDTVDAYVSSEQDKEAPYYSLTRHLMVPDYLVINTDRLRGLDAADQATLTGQMSSLIDTSNHGVLEYEARSRSKAEAQGVTINDADTASFAARTQDMTTSALTNETRTSVYGVIQSANQSHP